MSDPPFSRLGIVGLGLIGGSVALAARRAWPDMKIAGLDRSAATAHAARGVVVDDVVDDLAALSGSDLVLLAIPPANIIELMPALAPLPAVITDVGSTKRQVMDAAARAGMTRFVGGHPMGGSEGAGLGYARADLFEQRPWLLVPGRSGEAECRRVERFAAGLGAVPQWTDAATHDRMVAYVSHLPQLVAVALMNAATAGVGMSGLSAAGRGFGDMTRLSSSQAELWRDILSGNADFVAEALGRFIESLPGRDDLTNGRWVADAFAQAAAARAARRVARTSDE